MPSNEEQQVVNVVKAKNLPVITDASQLSGKAVTAFDRLSGKVSAVDIALLGSSGGGSSDLVGVKVGSGAINAPVNGVVTLPSYPATTSELTNDSGFITQDDAIPPSVIYMNDGLPYDKSGTAEAAAATAEWAGDPLKTIFQYWYNGTHRGIGSGLIQQRIYELNSQYYCYQRLYLGSSMYERRIAIASFDNTLKRFTSVTSVGSWIVKDAYSKSESDSRYLTSHQSLSGYTKIKSDTTAGWRNRLTYIPEKDEVLIYTDYSSIEKDGETVDVPGIKIGDGLAYGIDLPFVGEDMKEAMLAHIADNSIHVTSVEKNFWNNKLGVNDSQEVIGERLVFSRDY